MPTIDITVDEAQSLAFWRDKRLRSADKILLDLHLLNIRLRDVATEFTHRELVAHLETIWAAIEFIAAANGERVAERKSPSELPLVIKRQTT